ncbi:hypothetical protein BJ546DRAFT_1064433 [Cryomyces antarcticus]
MGDFDEAFQNELARETWSFYSVGVVFVAPRIYSRIRRVGVQGLGVGDYLMLLACTWYTTLVVCLNVIARGGGSNLFEPSLLPTFTEKDIQERIKGSKIVIVSEQAMLNTIWTLKICMLFLYSRLTFGLKQQLAVKILCAYVACGWVACELAFFFACRPFSGYWAVPPPNPQCTTLQHYAYTQAVFNTTSDALMLLIPLPLLAAVSLPTKQKAALMGIFSMGIFVIIAAILTKVYNLSDVYSPTYMLWYTREASVAVYVSNLPMIWPLLCEWFPCLRTLTPRYSPSYSKRSKRQQKSDGMLPLSDLEGLKKTSSTTTTQRGVPMIRVSGDGFKNASVDKYDLPIQNASGRRRPSSDGDEHVMTAPWPKGGIRQETTFDVEKETRNGGGDNIFDWEHQGGNCHTVTIDGGDDGNTPQDSMWINKKGDQRLTVHER